MLYNVLKPFALSRDGIRVENLAAGAETEVPADLVTGLVREGYIAAAKAEALAHEPSPAGLDIEGFVEQSQTTDAVTGEALEPVAEAPGSDDGGTGDAEPLSPTDIPDDWASRHWKQRVKLAEAISGAVLSGDDVSGQANAIIAPAHEAQRAAKTGAQA